MFGFKKKEKKPLFIKAKDVFSIIKSAYYDDGMPFFEIDFKLEDKIYTIGSLAEVLIEGETVYFVFQGKEYDTYEEFAADVRIDGIKLSESDVVIEVVKHHELRTPWGDTRLAKMAIQ